MNSLPRLVLALMCVLSMAGCRTAREFRQMDDIRHDTLYQQQWHYDSIYTTRDRLLYLAQDTVFLRDRQVEYRYRLLHDSIFIHQTDTLRTMQTLTVEKKTFPLKLLGIVVLSAFVLGFLVRRKL